MCNKGDINAKAKPEIAFAEKGEEENPRREKRDSLRKEEALGCEMFGLQETFIRSSEREGLGNR